MPCAAFARTTLLLVAVSMATSCTTRDEKSRAARPAVSGPESGHLLPFPKVRFTDVTVAAGIDFTHFNGTTDKLLMPELFGSGCGFFDFDNDGDQDILLVNSCSLAAEVASGSPPTMALYRNDGSGLFQNVTAGSGLDASFFGMGVAFGDYDGDGRRDVFVTALGPNHLFRNVGQGRFVEVTTAAGVADQQNDWSTSCGWFDYDNDDDLDLFVCNYVEWSPEIEQRLRASNQIEPDRYVPPHVFDGSHCVLYRNESDGTFTDVSAAAGIRITNSASGKGQAKALGLCGHDVDNDGWIDLIVANDQTPTFLFWNRQDGTFEEIAIVAGISHDRNGIELAGMGIDIVQLPYNLGQAIAIGDLVKRETPIFIRKAQPLVYTDLAPMTGTAYFTRRVTTFGLLFFDYDLDGKPDLLQANGSIDSEAGSTRYGIDYQQETQLFRFVGRHLNIWAKVPLQSTGPDIGRPLLGRGAAFADIDLDGDLDLLVTHNGGRAMLLRNDQQLSHHWLRLKLVGTGGNHEAIGAWVVVRIGRLSIERRVQPTRSYLSQMELPITIGLGTSDQIDGLRVIWPDGTVQEIRNPKVDRLNVIRHVDLPAQLPL